MGHYNSFAQNTQGKHGTIYLEKEKSRKTPALLYIVIVRQRSSCSSSFDTSSYLPDEAYH